MKKAVKRMGIFVLALLVILVAAITFGRTFILEKIRSRFEAQLHKLRDAGYIVEYDSITIDWKQNTVEVFRLKIKNDLDSSFCQRTDFISAKYIKAEDFKILPLILKKHLSFGKIVLDSPQMVITEKFLRPDSIERKKKEFTIIIDDLQLPHIHFEVYDSRTCKTSSVYDANAMVQDFNLAFYEDRPMFIDIKSFIAENTRIQLRQEFYDLTIKSISFKPPLKIFDLDTLRIIPQLGKVAFGRKAGKETDRIEGVIPYVNLYGFTVSNQDSLVLKAQKLTTQVFLHVFRDKRQPFRNPYRPLPMEALRNLPVGLSIDQLVLNKSAVEYEEWGEESDSSGSVYFEKLFATINNINNINPDKKAGLELTAEGLLMGKGLVKVHAICPWDKSQRERIRGTVTGLPMKSLNQMLEPAIQVTAESGYLNRLDFNFTCNNVRSQGEVELNYKDLKLITYKNENRIEKIRKRKRRRGESENDEKVRKAAFKTFVVNTFIIKKDMDKGMPEEKRTGTIDFERDQHKSVFNFWWKSVLSGVKSAYNLEKLEDSKITKMIRKKDKG